MPTFDEIFAALRDTTRATTWWGECAHAVALVWFLLVASVGLDVPVIVAFLVFWLLVSVPFFVFRRRRWRRLGRRDPLMPGVALAGLVVAIVAGGAVVLSAGWSLWAFGLALTGCQVACWLAGRRLVARRPATSVEQPI